MTLRTRLFLLFAVLVVALVAAGAWGIRSLTEELSAELGRVAESVGASVMSFAFSTRTEGEETPGGAVWISRTDEKGGMRIETKGEDGETEEVSISHTPDGGLHIDHEAGGDEDEATISLLTTEGGRVLTVTGLGEREEIPVPDAGVRSALDRFAGRVGIGALVLLGCGLLGAALVAHGASVPLRRLSRAAEQVGQGELGSQVEARASGEVGQAIAAFNAMSGRLRELDEANRRYRARAHLTELGEVARGLAHSLRNPLNTLGLAVEELAGATDGGRGAELAETARHQIRRMDRTVRSFLALASGVSEAVPVPVGAVLRDVALEEMQRSPGGASVVVAGEEATVLGVEPELRAALQVLVENAVECGEGPVEAKLERIGEGRVRITVTDRGPGLPQEVRSRLFSPHVTTKPDGAGMGLFLAHRLATTRYGGRLELLEREGGGTRAVLEIGDRLDGDA